MNYPTVGQLKDGVAGLLTGVDLQNVTNIEGAIQRAVRSVVARAKPPEGVGFSPYLLYDGVTDYLVPQAIFGGGIVDFQPQGVSRNWLDEVYRLGVERFDITKTYWYNGLRLTFQYRNGTPIMQVVTKRTTQKLVLDPMSQTTGWATGGLASGLVQDLTVFWQSPAALRFSIAAGIGAGTISKTLTTPIDITAYLSVGVVFIPVYLDPATNLANISSIEVRLGSDFNNYYDISVNAGFIGAFQVGQYFMVALNMANATIHGSPVSTEINSVEILVNVSGAVQNVRMGYFFMALPSAYNLIFTSNAPFLVNGVLSQTITTDDDQIAWLPGAYQLLEYEAALTIGIQMGGSLAGGLLSNIGNELNGVRTRTGAVVQYGLYDLYRADNPSEEIKTIGTYY